MNTCGSTAGFLNLIDVQWPIVQAPMAGTATPAMAAAVSNMGGLGSLGIGAMTPQAVMQAVASFRQRSGKALNLNVFCHAPAVANTHQELAWLDKLAPEFEKFGGTPPKAIGEAYKSFVEDDEMFSTILSLKPKVVSFHFGIPCDAWIRELRRYGIVLFATATSLSEAQVAVKAGVQVIVAQGYEAGGHRGVFNPDAEDDQLGTIALTRLLRKSLNVPIIAAGGIMDGQGIAAMIRLGASAAQLGTAFIAAHESAADPGHRSALFSDAAHHTVMTRVISGRPARCLSNCFTAFGRDIHPQAIPAYPIAYDAGKALNAAARSKGELGYGAQWAGQGAPLARSMTTENLMSVLIDEMNGGNTYVNHK
ncbi:nitronate monooxygenase [Acetobacter fabarum]|uniref:NAD(P)H-dependent flavin oxidoreductase n=1 Tax=Acetobacter fabarum TaxID=483199 RepID=UPI00312B7303